MDPRAQDILLCDLCGTDPLLYFCEQCDINLCTNCIAKHSFDSSKQHKILPYHLHRKFAPQYSKCTKHADKECLLFCEKCEIPVCSTCVTSASHNGHDISDVLKKLSSKKQRLQKELEELETKIYPLYEEMASDVQTENAAIETIYRELTTAADQQGEALHREVTAIVNQRKSNIAEEKNKHMDALKIQTDEITQRMSEMKQVILEMKNILETKDISLTSTYKSRNDEFNKLPSKIKVHVTVPSLSTPIINTTKLNEMIGSLSPLVMIFEPRLTAIIDTGYTYLFSVSCLSDQRVWTRGNNEIMKLLNLQCKLLTSIQTESGNVPLDIAVTKNGNLVYTDIENKTVNLVKNKTISTVITLQGWIPRHVCITASNKILITMVSDDYKQSKVVRYSCTKEPQTIQFDDQGRPLYSSGPYTKYISENKNMDICVADNRARAVVVVSHSGKFRFRYTGHPSDTEESFAPVGIATDSQGHILTADRYDNRIHILDQDGQFLRYIQNCHLERPHGLCVDIKDSLFVAEEITAKVKKIQYLF